MLKIKAERMKDLEKFKFDNNNPYYYKYISEDEYIWINKNTRIIDLTTPKPIHNYGEALNIIYDLIKADMVEKVVEDE